MGESQERELQRFDEVLNQEMPFNDTIEKSLPSTNLNDEPSFPDLECDFMDMSSLLNKSSQNYQSDCINDHPTRLYAEHFRRQEKFRLVKEIQEKERKLKRERSQVNSVSHALLRQKEEINLYKIYEEGLNKY